ncbi:MAG: GntR family transcriptional regulator [Lachnospiraceae bacterium]|nr:GntR family transcriptional regulator [Lachnospiraceae bacterium]
MCAKDVKYRKIEEDIIEAIKEGRLRPGDRIDSESVLKQRYGVSTITVRRAFSDLISQGYLNGVQGVGTFVAKKQMIRALTSISFSEELLEQKYVIDLYVDAIEEIIDKRISEALDIAPEQSVIRVKRVRMANEDPVAYHISYIDSRILSLKQAQEIYERKSFYKTLDSIGRKPTWAVENYSVRDVTDAHISELMGIPKGNSAFFIKRTAYNDEDKVVEYSETYFHKDWYSVNVTIKI